MLMLFMYDNKGVRVYDKLNIILVWSDLTMKSFRKPMLSRQAPCTIHSACVTRYLPPVVSTFPWATKERRSQVAKQANPYETTNIECTYGSDLSSVHPRVDIAPKQLMFAQC